MMMEEAIYILRYTQAEVSRWIRLLMPQVPHKIHQRELARRSGKYSAPVGEVSAAASHIDKAEQNLY